MSVPIAAWRATYTPGSWVVMSGPRSLVILQPAPPRVSGLLSRFWDDVLNVSSIEELSDALAKHNLAQLPSFALLFWDEEGMHALTRGEVRFTDANAGVPLASGDGFVTWTEAVLGRDGAVKAELEAVDPSRVLQLPLAVGVVAASSVVLSTREPGLIRSTQTAWLADPGQTEVTDEPTDVFDEPVQSGPEPGGQVTAEPVSPVEPELPIDIRPDSAGSDFQAKTAEPATGQVMTGMAGAVTAGMAAGAAHAAGTAVSAGEAAEAANSADEDRSLEVPLSDLFSSDPSGHHLADPSGGHAETIADLPSPPEPQASSDLEDLDLGPAGLVADERQVPQDLSISELSAEDASDKPAEVQEIDLDTVADEPVAIENVSLEEGDPAAGIASTAEPRPDNLGDVEVSLPEAEVAPEAEPVVPDQIVPIGSPPDIPDVAVSEGFAPVTPSQEEPAEQPVIDPMPVAVEERGIDEESNARPQRRAWDDPREDEARKAPSDDGVPSDSVQWAPAHQQVPAQQPGPLPPVAGIEVPPMFEESPLAAESPAAVAEQSPSFVAEVPDFAPQVPQSDFAPQDAQNAVAEPEPEPGLVPEPEPPSPPKQPVLANMVLNKPQRPPAKPTVPPAPETSLPKMAPPGPDALNEGPGPEVPELGPVDEPGLADAPSAVPELEPVEAPGVAAQQGAPVVPELGPVQAPGAASGPEPAQMPDLGPVPPFADTGVPSEPAPKLEEPNFPPFEAGPHPGFAQAVVPPPAGGLVSATVCQVGHPNPPGTMSCRQCDGPVGSIGRLVPRPVLAIIRSSFGASLELTTPILIGRAPDTRGDTSVQIMKVPSPNTDISRSHLRVQGNEWNIEVMDLNSTNGSVLAVPGRPPVQLVPGQATVVPLGTIVDLGDGIQIRIDPPRN